MEGLEKRIISQSANWTSEHSHIWSKDKLAKDYGNQFVVAITKEIDDWADQKLWPIVKKNMGVLDAQINEDLEAIRQDFRVFDQRFSTSLVTQFNNLPNLGSLGGIGTDGLGIASSINSDTGGAGGFIGGLGLGGAVVAGLLAFTGVGMITLILAGLAAAATGSFGAGLLDVDGIHFQIKQKICNLGFQKFDASSQSILDKIQERIIAVFDERVEANSDVMSKAISLCENLLEQQQRRDQQTQKQCESEKVLLTDKRRELEDIRNQMETIFN